MSNKPKDGQEKQEEQEIEAILNLTGTERLILITGIREKNKRVTHDDVTRWDAIIQFLSLSDDEKLEVNFGQIENAPEGMQGINGPDKEFRLELNRPQWRMIKQVRKWPVWSVNAPTKSLLDKIKAEEG